MIHHQRDICLGIVAEIFAFRNAAADELMISLAAAFLVGSAGVAVEHSGSAVTVSGKFNCIWVGKLAAVIS